MRFPRFLLFSFTVGIVSGAHAQTPAIFAPGVISGPLNDAAPAFTPDGHTVYFQRGGPELTTTIMMSHLAKGQWSMPVVASFSGDWQNIEPAMAPDGSYLIFSSNRPAMAGAAVLNGYWSGKRWPGRGGNLWRVDRKNDGWGQPVRLPDIVNSDSSVFSPAITADGSLYFMKPLADTGKFHLYRCAWRNGQYEAPIRLSFSMTDTVGDFDPAVAPDDSYLVFCSGRRPAAHTELWIVFRDHDSWGKPVSLGPEINRNVGNIEARLSPDQRLLYFSSSYMNKSGMTDIWFVPLDGFEHRP